MESSMELQYCYVTNFRYNMWRLEIAAGVASNTNSRDTNANFYNNSKDQREIERAEKAEYSSRFCVCLSTVHVIVGDLRVIKLSGMIARHREKA
ncbi:hypothetical protein OUZ56_014218 [Daphnia magna]|uniref:Uncharacterized protein n=1 Tax=Daphnia magna TaxID=35525 RepID=A0ABQ9Z855_9CRUS|nr:hypothetical protein OUZ56_014218 [Daphnia magna]